MNHDQCTPGTTEVLEVNALGSINCQSGHV
jgi:hypothetical protein